MPYFIKVSENIRDSLINRSIVQSRYKPKPYKEWRVLTEDERIAHSGYTSHWVILLSGREDFFVLRDQTLDNYIIEYMPVLAKELDLKFDISHEYWRNQ